MRQPRSTRSACSAAAPSSPELRRLLLAILDRRRRITLEARDVWLISPEDLILLKAFSKRERDFEDLVALFRHSGSKVDKPYIDKWAASLDESIGRDEVTERIQRAQQQAQRRSSKK